MVLYRFYSLDCTNRITAPCQDVHCDSDNGAIMEVAPGLMYGQAGIEIWAARRFVARLSAEHYWVPRP